MQEVYEFLKKCKTYYLATVEGTQPRVRPFGTVDLFEGKIYIQTGKVKSVSRQLLENPQVEICAFDGTHWLRVAATAVEDDRVEARRHMPVSYTHLDVYKRQIQDGFVVQGLWENQVSERIRIVLRFILQFCQLKNPVFYHFFDRGEIHAETVFQGFQAGAVIIAERFIINLLDVPKG